MARVTTSSWFGTSRTWTSKRCPKALDPDSRTLGTLAEAEAVEVVELAAKSPLTPFLSDATTWSQGRLHEANRDGLHRRSVHGRGCRRQRSQRDAGGACGFRSWADSVC